MDADIVPATALVPPEAHGRGFSPHDSALVLDGYLRRLACQNARCRAVLGRLARKFLARRGHHELGFAFAHPHDSLLGGLEKLLVHVKTEWEAQPRHRDPIFARDRWRCAVPICTARRELHDHHVVFRSHGGGNERENRVTLCAWHHLRGVHAGITWEIGVHAGRRPLIRTDAEGYY